MIIYGSPPSPCCGGNIAAEETGGPVNELRVFCFQCGRDFMGPLPVPRTREYDVDPTSDFEHQYNQGCAIEERCLDCPLSRCILEDRQWFLRGRKAALAEQIRRLWNSGHTMTAIGDALGRSNGTVRKVLADHSIQTDYTPADLEVFIAFQDVETREMTRPRRRCLDCQADISQRPRHSKRCASCAIQASNQASVRWQKARRLQEVAA